MKYLYSLLIVAWAVGVVYFFYYWIIKEKKLQGRRKKKSRRRKGKRCPNCKNMIDSSRDVCQHCGHKFQLEDRDSLLIDTPNRDDRSKKRGKRCPECRNKVDSRRAVCQYCGYEFFEFKGKISDSDKEAANPGDTPSD